MALYKNRITGMTARSTTLEGDPRWERLDAPIEPDVVVSDLTSTEPVELETTKLEDLTVAELRDLAAQNDIVLPAKASKADIIDLLHDAPALDTED